MKKTLALLLVLCMLIIGCAAFSSCGSSIDAKDVEKDAQGVLTGAFNNTTELFFSDYAGMGKVVDSSVKGGSVTFGFEGDKALVGSDMKIYETLYFNRKNHQYVSDTSVKINEESYDARIFLDETGIALNSESILGNKNTLAINFETLANNIDTSAIKDFIGLQAAGVDQFKQLLDVMKAEYAALFAENADEASKAEANAILALMNQVVAVETIKNANGDDVSCVVVSYTITNTTYKAIISKMLTDSGITGEKKAEAEAAIDEALATMTVNLSQKIYINARSNQVEKISLTGTMTTADQPSGLELNTELVFGETAIKLTLNATVAGSKLVADVTLSKEEKKDSVAYKLAVNAGDGKGATVNFLNANYTYTKKTGAIVLAVDAYNEDADERTSITINGSIVVNKNDAKIEINSLKTGNKTYNFKVSLAFNKKADIPARPADAKDIATMTEAELQAVVNDFMQKGKLGQLIGGGTVN